MGKVAQLSPALETDTEAPRKDGVLHSELAPETRKVRDQNNFGFLRLLFAVLVILAHAPEIVDGNRSRELLTRLFGTMSFGEVAVDGFFLISGYLITKSWLRSNSTAAYLKKRVNRIYPGFIAAFLLCLFVFEPLGGGGIPLLHLSAKNLGVLVLKLFTLHAPDTGAAFQGLHYQKVNDAMWTIVYEFRCYLLVIVLGSLGLFKQRKAMLVLAAACLAILPMTHPTGVSSWHSVLVGTAHDDARFFAAFIVGNLFFLYRDRIRLSLLPAVASAIVLLCAMPFPKLAEPALLICGGYCLFWFALHAKANILSRIDNRWDLSYGTYLYGWPIATLIVWHVRNISPWLLFAMVAPLAMIMGLLSWTLIESRFLPTKTHAHSGKQITRAWRIPAAALSGNRRPSEARGTTKSLHR